MDELLTPAEVERILKISRATVYAMSSDGRLPKVKIGSALRFRRAVIEEFIDRSETPREVNA